MAWCPNCKNEYKEGISVCSDCGSALVARLETDDKCSIVFGKEEQMQRLMEFLCYNQIATAELSYDIETDMHEIKVSKEELDKAKKAAIVFLREEAKKEKQMTAAAEEDDDDIRPVYSYVKAEDKAENFKSSAYALLLTGGIGIVAMILIIAGVIPVYLAANIRIIVYIVLSLLFLIFFVIGIRSLKEAKKYARDAEQENDTTEKIIKWFLETYSKESIDARIEEALAENDTEEIKYFKRIDAMKTALSEQYQELEQAYLEKIIDDLYQELYEQ